MKIKVLHIVEAFGGGVFTFLVDLLNKTSEKCEVVLACSIREQTPDNYKKYLSKSIKVIELKNGTRKVNFMKDIRLTKEIYQIIKQEKPDIIHLHSSKAGFIGRIILRDKKNVVFYNPHGFSFLQQNNSKLKNIFYKTLEIIASKKCGTIVAVSKGEYDESIKISKKVVEIDNGIDVDKFPSMTKENENNEVKVCTLGRICFQKNPDCFNKVADKLENIKFTWIGDGEMRDNLKSKNIEVTGWVKKEEALKIMNDNNIFILASLWEGLPIALLEAMYLKKICIVSNSIGNRDVIINNVNGFITETDSDYIEIINKIINNQIDVNEISMRAYDDVLTRYNMNIVSKKYMSLYNSYLVTDINKKLIKNIKLQD